MTRALMVTLAKWARSLPWRQVARLFGCSRAMVAGAVEEAVSFGLAHRDLEGLSHIGVDEISRRLRSCLGDQRLRSSTQTSESVQARGRRCDLEQVG